MSLVVGCPKCKSPTAAGMIRSDGAIVCNQCFHVIAEPERQEEDLSG